MLIDGNMQNNFPLKNVLRSETSLTDRERKVLQKKKNVFSKFMTENYCSYLRYSAETVPNKQLRTFDDHSSLNTIF